MEYRFKRIIGIDYIKTICMIMIVITHFSFDPAIRKSIIFPFFIDLAVPILMITTGFNYYNSTKKYDFGNLTEYVLNYFKDIKKKLKRILKPFLFMILITLIPMCVLLQFDLDKLALNIIGGGVGPGSYYTIIMIQLIIIYPFIYSIIEKSNYSIILVFIIQIIFELLIQRYNVSVAIYRLCSIRYFSFVALGTLYAKNSAIKIKVIDLMVGILMIYYLNYYVDEPILFKYWTTTSLPVIFLASFYFSLVFKLKSENQLINQISILISKSSFHIFLFQMTFYAFVFPILRRTFSADFFLFVLSLIVCIVGGILFYKFENCKLVNTYLKGD